MSREEVVQGSQTCQVIEAYIQLKEAMDERESKLDALQSRLHRAIYEHSPGEDPCETKSHGFSTPFASDLLQKADQIRNRNRILDDVISRLEI